MQGFPTPKVSLGQGQGQPRSALRVERQKSLAGRGGGADTNPTRQQNCFLPQVRNVS